MDTGSTASSRTDGPDPAPEASADHPRSGTTDVGSGTTEREEAPAGRGTSSSGTGTTAAAGQIRHDPGRRAFFREFGRQAVNTVGQVAGMADFASRSSGTIAASLLGLGEERKPAPRSPYVRSPRRGGGAVIHSSAGAAANEDLFRSSYRLAGDEIMLLDQRGIPEALDEVSARRGSDVAYYLRVGVCRGGALMAQVAAYGLALTARERASQPAASRDLELRRTRRALAQARSSSRLPTWTMERMEAAQARLDDGADGDAVAAALWGEADTIAAAFSAGHAAIASHTAELLAAGTDEGDPIVVLVHGDPGALTGGLVGTGIPALRQLVEAGRALRVFVTETRPFMDGARLASWELRQAGIEHQLIPDSAVAWLLAREPIDAVLIGAEWVAANGDVAAVLGSRAIALQVAAGPDRPDGRRTRIIALGVSSVVDAGTADGGAIPVELRPARDQAAYLADTPIRAGAALAPATDVMPAATVSALVTERGAISPLDAAGLATLEEAGSPAAEGDALTAAAGTPSSGETSTSATDVLAASS